MRKLIAILMLYGSVAIGATNYFTDVTVTGTPYLTTNIMQELVVSVDEKETIVSGAFSLTNLEEGGKANMRTTTSVSDFGMFVYEVRLYFSTTYYGYSSIGWLSDIPTESFVVAEIQYANIYEAMAAAGLTNGWRMATNYNPAVNNWRDRNDPMYSTTTNTAYSVVTGEILGPWIVDDLHIALTAMRHWVYESAYVNEEWVSTGLDTNLWFGSATGKATFNNAKTDAEVAWSGSFTTGFILPRKYTRGTYNETGPTYDAQAWSRIAKLRYSFATNNAVNALGGQARAYISSEPPDITVSSSVFDANGTGLVDGEFILYDTQIVSLGNTNAILGAAFGDDTFPSWTAEPTSTTNSTALGYYIENQLVIISPDWTYVRK